MENKTLYFKYSDEAIQYLKNKDKKLAQVIEQVGEIKREINPDLFSSVVHHIIGQQISTVAQLTIWKRLCDKLKIVNAQTINEIDINELQSIGISFRKAEYIKDFAHKVSSGEFDVENLIHLSDEEVIKSLSSLKGIGEWTAEMLMIFSMQRQNILSFGDLAILRGMRMLYHHRKIDKKLFDKYARRYSPYATVASLYLWAIAGGAIPDMKDYAPKKIKKT